MTTKIDNIVERDYNTVRVDDWGEKVNSRIFIQYKKDRFKDSLSIYSDTDIYDDEDIHTV